MHQYRQRSIVVSVLLVSQLRLCLAQGSVDPAPPKAAVIAGAPISDPKAQEGLKFIAPPKPLAPGAVTTDWRNFLGPSRNGTSPETPLLKAFGKSGPTIVWEVPKGEGYATPAVVGDRVILFHRIGDDEVVECLQAESGKRFWKISYPTAFRDPYGWSGGPRCPPVSDGKCVVTYGGEGKLSCVDLLSGQVIWRRDIPTEFKLGENFFGVGATPLIENGLVIVNVGADGGPCVAGFDIKTGRMVWGAGKEWGPSYASPIPADVNGKRRVFVFAGGMSRPAIGGLLCIDPSNGKVDFTFPWRAKRFESVNASAPLVVGNQVFISECYGAGGTLLDVLANGSYKQVWSNNNLGTHFMTAIQKDGYLYGIDGHGPYNAPIVCIELKTGKEMWRAEPEWVEEVKEDGGPRKTRMNQGLASFILVDGRCLMLTEYGHLVWLDLNPKEYKELDRTKLFLSRYTWGTPALSRGLLYVCQHYRSEDGTEPRLICYDLRGDKK